MPSDCHWYAKTIARSELLARLAADCKSVPGSKVIFAFGNFSRRAFRGDVGNQTWSCQFVAPLPGGMIALPPGGSTWAEPPPEIIPTSARPPIIAIVCTLDGRIGSTA